MIQHADQVTIYETEEEVALVLSRQAQAPTVSDKIQARRVVIQHADQVTIYTTGGDTPI